MANTPPCPAVQVLPHHSTGTRLGVWAVTDLPCALPTNLDSVLCEDIGELPKGAINYQREKVLGRWAEDWKWLHALQHCLRNCGPAVHVITSSAVFYHYNESRWSRDFYGTQVPINCGIALHSSYFDLKPRNYVSGLLGSYRQRIAQQ